MIKTLFCFLFFFSVARAESIQCRAAHGGKVKSLSFARGSNGEGAADWLEGTIKYRFQEKKRINFRLVPKADQLVYIESWDSYLKRVKLELGTFRGVGVYDKAALTVPGRSGTETVEMNCRVEGEVPFKNHCIETENYDPQASLLVAAKRKRLNEIEALVACGLNFNAKDTNGCTPLLLVTDSSCGTGTFDSISQNSFPFVNALTESGAIIESRDPVTRERPIHKVTRRRETSTVGLLIDLEADVNARDGEGYTPLMRAVENWDRSTVTRILEADVDLSLKNNRNEDAKTIALRMGLEDIALLLEKPTNTISISGQTDGSCSPQNVEIKVNEATLVELISSPSKMFMLTSRSLSLSLMSDAGKKTSQRIVPKQVGTFEFSCGVHGGAQTLGKITVK